MIPVAAVLPVAVLAVHGVTVLVRLVLFKKVVEPQIGVKLPTTERPAEENVR